MKNVADLVDRSTLHVRWEQQGVCSVLLASLLLLSLSLCRGLGSSFLLEN